MEDSEIKLIIGLGNPGSEYDHTRHNIGFAVVDAFIAKYGIDLSKESKFKAELGSKNISNDSREFKLICAKPQTYMNDSGKAVSKIVNYYKIAIEDILVIQDDTSLDTGKLKFAHDSGAGGHHGIEDTILHLGGTKKFHRLKIGVGPDPGGDERSDFVLAKFRKSEREQFDAIVQESVIAVEKWLCEPNNPKNLQSSSITINSNSPEPRA